MINTNSQHQEVEAIVSKVKTAVKVGKLSKYKPLTISGSDETKSTCTASWGPLMRR